MTTLAGDRYIVISSDGHAGAQVHEYRDYLESKYHDEFDAWASDVREPVRRPPRRLRVPQLGQHRRGCASSRTTASSPRCSSRTRSRRSSRRATCSARPPADDEYELRWAGPQGAQPLAGRLLRRDARAGAPGWRRCSSTTSTTRSPRSSGRPSRGCAAGILLPGVPPDSGLPPIYSRAYDRLWAGVPGPRHADQQPQRRRRPRAGARRHRHGGVHGRAGMVLAPRVLAHGHRRRVRRATRASG